MTNFFNTKMKISKTKAIYVIAVFAISFVLMLIDIVSTF